MVQNLAKIFKSGYFGLSILNHFLISVISFATTDIVLSMIEPKTNSH